MDTIQTTTLLRTVRILRIVLKNCCHSNSSERPSGKTGVKNSQGVNNYKNGKENNSMAALNV